MLGKEVPGRTGGSQRNGILLHYCNRIFAYNYFFFSVKKEEWSAVGLVSEDDTDWPTISYMATSSPPDMRRGFCTLVLSLTLGAHTRGLR